MRYIADSVISFSIMVNGRDKRIRFNPLMGGGSVYVTENVAEIKVLEASATFKRGIFRRAAGYENINVKEPAQDGNASLPENKREVSKVKGKNAESGQKKEKTEIVGAVTTIQEAAEYLIEKFGLEPDDLTDPDTILAVAAEKKVEFPDLK